MKNKKSPTLYKNRVKEDQLGFHRIRIMSSQFCNTRIFFKKFLEFCFIKYLFFFSVLNYVFTYNLNSYFSQYFHKECYNGRFYMSSSQSHITPIDVIS